MALTQTEMQGEKDSAVPCPVGRGGLPSWVTWPRSQILKDDIWHIDWFVCLCLALSKKGLRWFYIWQLGGLYFPHK